MAKENKNFVKGKAGTFKYCDRNISGVYSIVNDKTKEFYIGSSLCINTRLSHHFGNLKKNKHTCERLQKSFNNHKYEDFSFYILYKSDNEKLIREKELKLLEANYDNPLLLNTATLNNNWVDERNKEKVRIYKEKLSKIAKSRTGNKNHFYGKHHTEKTKQKLREIHLGKKNEACHKPIVINGVFYKSLDEASRKLKIHTTTIFHRVRNKNKLFANWYYYSERNEVKIIDDRLLFDVKSKPSGLYEVEGKLYTDKDEIMKTYNLKSSTLYYRFNSENFKDWKRLI